MAYLVPDNALEFEPDQVSEGDLAAIKAILQERQIPGTLVKLFVVRGGNGTYYAVTEDGDVHNTVEISLPTLTRKQWELGQFS